MKRNIIFIAWLVSTFSTTLQADTVTLKDGSQKVGRIETGAAGEVHLKVNGQSQVIAVDRIQSIQFDTQESFAPILPPVVLTAAPATITLPSGTEIAIRTIDRIDSKKADTYKEYAASLDDPVVINGATVIPVNANAYLKASDIHAPGVTHRASLSLTLVAVVINGQRMAVETGKVDSQSGSPAKRAAATTLGGAVAGAAIGAKVAGGVGAVVGAGVGGVSGAVGGKMLAKGVEIAPETRFSYKLTQPVVIGNAGGAQ
jgi:hypothetical protein